MLKALDHNHKHIHRMTHYWCLPQFHLIMVCNLSSEFYAFVIHVILKYVIFEQYACVNIHFIPSEPSLHHGLKYEALTTN